MAKFRILLAIILVVASIVGVAIGRRIHLRLTLGSTGLNEVKLPEAGCYLYLPPFVKWQKEPTSGGELRFHLTLYAYGEFVGYIQCWHVMDIQQFLTDSRDNSQSVFLDYEVEPTKEKDSEGLMVYYRQRGYDGRDLSARECWLWRHHKHERLRVAFFYSTGSMGRQQWESMVNAAFTSLELLP